MQGVTGHSSDGPMTLTISLFDGVLPFKESSCNFLNVVQLEFWWWQLCSEGIVQQLFREGGFESKLHT